MAVLVSGSPNGTHLDFGLASYSFGKSVQPRQCWTRVLLRPIFLPVTLNIMAKYTLLNFWSKCPKEVNLN